MSTSPIPGVYRFLFTTFEPLLATAGAANALFFPSALLAWTVPTVPYSPSLSPLLTQATGAWLMLAFHDFVTLRSVAFRDDLRAWRHTLTASAISDVFYTASLVQSMGSALFFNPLRWDLGTFVAITTTVAPFLGKLCFLAGIGLPATGTVKRIDAKKAT